MLWGAFANEDGSGDEVIKDPYYGGQSGFEMVYGQCVRYTENFLRAMFPAVRAQEDGDRAADIKERTTDREWK